MSNPTLADIIRQTQVHLEEAQRRRIKEGGGKFLRLKQLEFELKCIAVENADIHGGFDLKVVSLGSVAKTELHKIHTIKVVFEGLPDFVGGICQECGNQTMFTKDGCETCSMCGASRCG